MDDNMMIYNQIRTAPAEALKSITGGRLSGKTDINPMWRIKMLTQIFGPCGIGWYYKPVRKWTETCGDGPGAEISAFVDIELYVKVDGEWSMPISGTGGSMLAAKERSGIYVSDECYKMATTDAISVACKQLGFAANVYWDRDDSKYQTGQPQDQKGSNQPAGQPPNAYRCESCGKAFEAMDFKGKHYTPKQVYENAKKASGGRAICRTCKQKESS